MLPVMLDIRTNVRWETKKEAENLKRAARILRVSRNRFMRDAIAEKVAAVMASLESRETSQAAD